MLHIADCLGAAMQAAKAELFGAPLEMSRLGAYSLGFLLFWILGSACSALTCLLQRSPYEMNRCTIDPEARPEGCPKRCSD